MKSRMNSSQPPADGTMPLHSGCACGHSQNRTQRSQPQLALSRLLLKLSARVLKIRAVRPRRAFKSARSTAPRRVPAEVGRADVIGDLRQVDQLVLPTRHADVTRGGHTTPHEARGFRVSRRDPAPCTRPGTRGGDTRRIRKRGRVHGELPTARLQAGSARYGTQRGRRARR